MPIYCTTWEPKLKTVYLKVAQNARLECPWHAYAHNGDYVGLMMTMVMLLIRIINSFI